MLRFSSSRVINALKYNTKLFTDNKTCCAIIKLPLINSAQYSDGPKQQGPIKSPLGSLIDKGSTANKEDETKEDEESRKARENAWRTMKYTLMVFGVSFVCIGGYVIFEFGKPPVGDDGKPRLDRYSNLPLLKQYLYRTLNELDYYKRLIKEPSRDKLLPDPLKYPYYQPPYTLVLELTDVLVHPDWTYKTGWRFKKRPGIEHFLENLSGLYEIVIYTAEQGMTVFPIIEALDPKNLISYKLVRDATHFTDGHHVKNLDKLNRDLSKVIVVDWNLDSVKFHPDNVLHIPRWSGNDDDAALVDLAAFLRIIAQTEIDDVREVLKHYKDYDDPLFAFRERQKKLIEQQEAERDAKSSQAPAPVRRWTPSFLSRSF